MKKRYLIIPVLIGLLLFGAVSAFAQETCPDGNGWVKIDSDDLSSYPVPGAVDYCFKAGSDASQGCVGGIFSTWPPPVDNYCDLSHWSYKAGETTPTPTPPVDPTPTPPVDPTPTPPPWTPTPDPCVPCVATEDFDPYDVLIIRRHVEDQTCLFYVDFDGALHFMQCFDTCGVVDPCNPCY